MITRYKRRDGRIAWRLRAVVNGEEKSLGLFDSREEAEAVERAFRAQVSPTAALTLRVWGARWLDRRETAGLHRDVRTSRSVWRTHVDAAHFADVNIRKIRRADVVRWVRERMSAPAVHAHRRGRETERRELTRTVSRGTVQAALVLLRRALADALDEGHVSENAAGDVRVPRRPRTDEPWTWLRPHEVEALLASELRSEQRAIYTVAICTGLRAGELFGLRWADVMMDGDSPELVVRHSYRGPTKSGKVRRVPLLARAREALTEWRRHVPGVGAALVFPADAGRRRDGLAGCHSPGYDAGLESALRGAGIERRVRFHDLRHTCASALVQGTWGPPLRLEEVRQWLGHGSVTVTERYAHLAPDGLRSVARRYDALGTEDDAQSPTPRRK